MRGVGFLRLLDDGIRLRARFVTESGMVVQFTVQLEWFTGGRWIGLIRYDTAHGFAHCDTMHPYEPATKTRVSMQEFGDALTFAVDDLLARISPGSNKRRLCQKHRLITGLIPRTGYWHKLETLAAAPETVTF